jgi:hypothetical protein
LFSSTNDLISYASSGGELVGFVNSLSIYLSIAATGGIKFKI